ncbi:hypothetical protein SAMN04487897_11174 [Paenibacillus sp. yr247]|nr:hypothetical protein SAMN04487897_11174 [Paenibacillus sp. yr247]
MLFGHSYLATAVTIGFTNALLCHAINTGNLASPAALRELITTTKLKLNNNLETAHNNEGFKYNLRMWTNVEPTKKSIQ